MNGGSEAGDVGDGGADGQVCGVVDYVVDGLWACGEPFAWIIAYFGHGDAGGSGCGGR